jgi:hypothetical protein
MIYAESFHEGAKARETCERALIALLLCPRVLMYVLTLNDHSYSAVRSNIMPFLDHRICEFVFSLPKQLKIRQSRLKFVLRDDGNDATALNTELKEGRI